MKQSKQLRRLIVTHRTMKQTSFKDLTRLEMLVGKTKAHELAFGSSEVERPHYPTMVEDLETPERIQRINGVTYVNNCRAFVY